MTWTWCQFVEGPEFNCPQHVGLINTFRQSLDEFWSFAWAKRLRSACKYYWVHKLEYEDVEGEIHVVKVVGTSRRAAAYATKVMDLVVNDVDEGDDFERAVDASLARASAPKTSGKSAAPADLDPLGLEAGFDELCRLAI